MKTWLAVVMVAEKVYCRCEEEHRQPGASGRVQTEHNQQVVPGHRGDREGAKRAHGIPKARVARLLWESRSWGKGRKTQRLERFRVGAGCASQGDSVTGAYHTESLVAGSTLLCLIGTLASLLFPVSQLFVQDFFEI